MYEKHCLLSVLMLVISACGTDPGEEKDIGESANAQSGLYVLDETDYRVGESVEGANPIERVTPQMYETFAGVGWNADNTTLFEYKPGLDTSLPKNFKFQQMQGPHSFSIERRIVRLGDYSAKLHWKHGSPASWNGDPDKLDNVDRKAMLHGKNAQSITSTIWYGFSVYFPSDGTELMGSEEALFFQVHGARDASTGEPNRIPPLALNIATDGFNVGYSWDSNKVSTSTRGEGNEKFDVPVKLSDYQNRWVDFVIQLRANPFDETGFIKIWIDGKQMVDQTNIKIGYNDDKGLYPSYGWYLWGDNAFREKDAILYLDEIRQLEAAGADYYDAAPGFFAE